MTWLAALLCACLLTGAFGESPRPKAKPPGIYLRHLTVDTSTAPSLLTSPSARYAPGKRYVVQLDGPMDPSRRAALRRAGATLGDYLPRNAYIVHINDPSARLPAFVRWVGLYLDEWKLDPTIGQRPLQSATRQHWRARGQVVLTITLFAGEDPAIAVQTSRPVVEQVRAASVVGRHGVIETRARLENVPDLAKLSAVQYVEEASEAVSRNDDVVWVLQSNIDDQTPIWDHGLRGEGQIAGLIDRPVDIQHCAFRDPSGEPIGPDHRKIIAYRDVIGSHSHGTHVAGTFVGDRQPIDGSTEFNGVAYRALLSFTDRGLVDSTNLETYLGHARDDGACVHSNSWGDDFTTDYTSWCQQIDNFTWSDEDQLVLFAITNAATLRTPENAKNVLAVAASQKPPNQDFHCLGGDGPTDDGRRKPELLSPGCGIWSADYNTDCNWHSASGTSTASPGIAGAALLARQYFTEGLYPMGQADPADEFVPSGTLLHAVLINAGQDMTGVADYPNDREGWGRLLLDESLYFVGDERKLYAEDRRRAEGEGLSTDEHHGFEVMTGADLPLRITLVWHDYPATVGAGFTPVNDLDLEVVAPDATLYLGNDFDVVAGESKTGGPRDDRNNVEQVHRKTPAIGLWTIIAYGRAVNEGEQGYALVVTGDLIAAAPCIGDIDGDGNRNFTDFTAFSSAWLSQQGEPNYNRAADFNRDGQVDFTDFTILAPLYLAPCP